MTKQASQPGHGVTLIGGGPVSAATLSLALSHAPRLVAADGGADRALALGHRPSRIIGDLDSLTTAEAWRKSGADVTRLDEQESTDFEKCIYSEVAQYYLCVGFVGARLDHTLACLSVLSAYEGRRIILMGEEDIVFHCPRELALDLRPGTRVSLFPMAQVTGVASDGLQWPIGGLTFSPAGQIGTSNRATDGPVRMAFDGPGMIVILPRAAFSPALAALLTTALPDAPYKDQPR